MRHDAVEALVGGARLVGAEVDKGDIFVDADRVEARFFGDDNKVVKLRILVREENWGVTAVLKLALKLVVVAIVRASELAKPRYMRGDIVFILTLILGSVLLSK